MRITWIEDTRKKAGQLLQENNIEKALEQYMMCLCALDFKSCSGSMPSDEQIKTIEKGFKVPVLNNMAVSLKK